MGTLDLWQKYRKLFFFEVLRIYISQKEASFQSVKKSNECKTQVTKRIIDLRFANRTKWSLSSVKPIRLVRFKWQKTTGTSSGYAKSRIHQAFAPMVFGFAQSVLPRRVWNQKQLRSTASRLGFAIS